MDDNKIITVLGGRVQLKQPENGFRTAIDAVLLAAACPVKKNQSLLDLGCGVGSAGLCVAARTPDIQLHGIDIQHDHIKLAQENAALNNVNATFETADITDKIPAWREEGYLYDHVICNPPFLDDGTHLKSPSESRATALGHQEETSLEIWLDACFFPLKHKGTLSLIHRADHMDRIIALLKKRFGKIELIPLWPKEGQPAKRVIIRATKNSNSPAIIHPGIILHEENGYYTKDAEEILRDMAPIFLDL